MVIPRFLEIKEPMAKHPAFSVQITHQNAPLVEVLIVDFAWVSGMAKSQKQKCVASCPRPSRNLSALRDFQHTREELGINLSAFNLGFVNPKNNRCISVGFAFQGRKVIRIDGSIFFPRVQAASVKPPVLEKLFGTCFRDHRLLLTERGRQTLP